ncbi:MAG: 16S rRNA (uracil(1498)-N(3))-methyltransferase [Pseudomonadota bacterium]
MARIPAWPPKSAPRLFVDEDLSRTRTVRIEGNQAHYLSRVMRVGEGSVVIMCDDLTGEWVSEVRETAKRHVLLEVTEQLGPRETVPDLWLCAALLKKDRFDLVLEKATELGADRIQPVITRRCVADKLNLERAITITIEAAEQCARTALPELREPESLKDLLENWPGDRRLFFADEQGGEPAADAFRYNSGPVGLLIGPEGGFDRAERDAVRAHPAATPISLGPRILRGETAAIAALSVWMATSGDWEPT